MCDIPPSPTGRNPTPNSVADFELVTPTAPSASLSMPVSNLPVALSLQSQSSLSVARKTFFMSIIVILGMVNSFGAGTTLIGPKIQEDLGFGTSELQVCSRWLCTGCVDVVVSILIRRPSLRLDVLKKVAQYFVLHPARKSSVRLLLSRSIDTTNDSQLTLPFTSLCSPT
jgi:hypothetical protein